MLPGCAVYRQLQIGIRGGNSRHDLIFEFDAPGDEYDIHLAPVCLRPLPDYPFVTFEPVDDAHEARGRNQRQLREPIYRDRIMLPEHPQYAPLLLRYAEIIEYLTKPRHNHI